MKNTEEQARWLENPESLSKRLREYTQNQIEFSLQSASFGPLSLDEAREFENSHVKRFWCREITWAYRGKYWVWARTVIPEDALDKLNADLMQNPALPIGDILFSDKAWQRQEIKIFSIDEQHVYVDELKNYEAGIVWPLAARRSTFCCQDKKILVSEVFFPEFLDCHPRENGDV